MSGKSGENSRMGEISRKSGESGKCLESHAGEIRGMQKMSQEKSGNGEKALKSHAGTVRE